MHKGSSLNLISLVTNSSSYRSEKNVSVKGTSTKLSEGNSQTDQPACFQTVTRDNMASLYFCFMQVPSVFLFLNLSQMLSSETAALYKLYLVEVMKKVALLFIPFSQRITT